MCHCFYCWGYIFRNMNWHILPGFFGLIFGISLAKVKPDVKNILPKSLFSRTWQPYIYIYIHTCIYIYIYINLCHCVLFLKYNIVHCVLSFWMICVMLRSYTCWCFCNNFGFFQTHMWLCVITANIRISPNQKRYELTFS